MNDFAHLLDRLAYEPRRNAKLRMLQDFFARTPDPERGYALGAMTGTLSFREAKPALIRGLVEERIDPVLFRLSHNYVGDLAETTALIWPGPTEAPREPGPGHNNPPPQVPTLAEVVETLATIPKQRTAPPSRGLARRPRRDRPLGAPEARHRQPAGRRLGAARQDRGRARWAATRPMPSRRSGTGSRRPSRPCSPGSRAGPRGPRP